MLTPHGLAYMADARTFLLHPGVDHPFKRSNAISTLGAIKAFIPVHLLILSATNVYKVAFSSLIGVYCNILASDLLDGFIL